MGLGILLVGFIGYFILIWDRGLPAKEMYQRASGYVNGVFSLRNLYFPEKLAILAQIVFNGLIDQGGHGDEDNEFAEYEPIFHESGSE